MKHYRQLFYALGGVLVLTLGILVFLVYQSGVEGRERYKMKAESLLKSTAELWVNHELDKLRIPYSFGGGEPAAQNGMRRMILADKEIAVKVDSVKESKLLFNSRALNAKSNLLILINDSSIFVLDKQWRENLQAVQLPDDCALELFNEQLDDTNRERLVTGDKILITDANRLGEYYLDDMYFFRLVSYLAVPSLWLCADWREIGIVLCIVVNVSCVLIILLLRLYRQKKKGSIKLFISDDIVMCISEDKYKMGDVVFNEKERTLTFSDSTVVDCPAQAYKLLSSIVHAENHFLAYIRIIEICGWNPNDMGVVYRRRMAISNVRKLLDSQKSHVYLRSSEKDKGVYLYIEK